MMDTVPHGWKQENLIMIYGKTDNDHPQLSKTFYFDTYAKVNTFVNMVMSLAPKLNHHPELVVNHNHVVVHLYTWDDDGNNDISNLDYEYARMIESQLEKV